MGYSKIHFYLNSTDFQSTSESTWDIVDFKIIKNNENLKVY